MLHRQFSIFANAYVVRALQQLQASDKLWNKRIRQYTSAACDLFISQAMVAAKQRKGHESEGGDALPPLQLSVNPPAPQAGERPVPVTAQDVQRAENLLEYLTSNTEGHLLGELEVPSSPLDATEHVMCPFRVLLFASNIIKLPVCHTHRWALPKGASSDNLVISSEQPTNFFFTFRSSRSRMACRRLCMRS